MDKTINHPSCKAFTLVEMMAVTIIIAGLLVIISRIYKTNSNYETAHQIDEFVKSVDKGLFVANAELQNNSFRFDNNNAFGNEGDNGGLYLMVPDTSFDSVYNALMKGDCMIRCFDIDNNNNSQCGIYTTGNTTSDTSDFNDMCRNDSQTTTLCLEKVFDKKYIDTYMMPTIIQGKISFDTQVFDSAYQVVKDVKSSKKITIGQLVKLDDIVIDLSDNPNVISILQNIDNRYQGQGNSVVYPLNNGAGHFVIVRNGYTCR